jgi:hypothetical protein
VRTGVTPNEIYVTAWGVRNANADASVTVRCLVLRDTFGAVLWESEPALGMPHPANTDYPSDSPARDITTVPAGAARYIRTLHFPWTLNPVPAPAGAGNLLTMEMDLSTEGDPDAVGVGASRTARERLGAPGAFFEGAERVRDSTTCIRIKSRERD